MRLASAVAVMGTGAFCLSLIAVVYTIPDWTQSLFLFSIPGFAGGTLAADPALMACYQRPMKARFAALAIAIAAAVPQQAGAALSLIGTGTASCGTWTVSRAHQDTLDHYLLEQWVLGFIAGAAYESPDSASEHLDPLRNVDAQAVWAWMDNYCRASPLDEIVNGAEVFIAQHPR